MTYTLDTADARNLLAMGPIADVRATAETHLTVTTWGTVRRQTKVSSGGTAGRFSDSASQDALGSL